MNEMLLVEPSQRGFHCLHETQ